MSLISHRNLSFNPKFDIEFQDPKTGEKYTHFAIVFLCLKASDTLAPTLSLNVVSGIIFNLTFFCVISKKGNPDTAELRNYIIKKLQALFAKIRKNVWCIKEEERRHTTSGRTGN